MAMQQQQQQPSVTHSFSQTKAFTSVKKWLGSLPSSTTGGSVRQDRDDDVFITHVRALPRPAAIRIPNASLERPGMRTTSDGGHRDEDVEEVVPQSYLDRGKRVFSAAMYADDEAQGLPSVPMPEAKKAKTSQNRSLPTTLRRPERADRQLQLLQQAAERQQEIQPEQAVQSAESAVQQQQQQAVQTRPRRAAAKTSQPECQLPVDYFFTNLSLDVRNNIYRHLLVSHTIISVASLWTELAYETKPRGRRGGRNAPTEDRETFIDSRILRVCKQAFEEGARVLYSENTFLYKIRQRYPKVTLKNRNYISFDKYGHLFRYMSVELEGNRREQDYENSMATVLKSLTNKSDLPFTRRKALLTPSPASEIRLHTLSITISPEWNDASASGQNGGGSNDSTIDRSLSTVMFFGDGHEVMRALRAINTNFIRINIHVKEPRDEDDEEDEPVDATLRHLETTLDLRYHPFHLASKREYGLAGNMLQNDPIIQKQSNELGIAAEEAFSSLRKRIVAACADPDDAVEKGWWEDHAVAEKHRKQKRLRFARMFEGIREKKEKVEIERACVITINREKMRVWVSYRNYDYPENEDEE
ncbi:hypothetical protein QBC34DRAFT_435051 [Podospora aff. communis PSN243]|uniref:Uncharacterized protein n=1 Tax=Podospora aff. communis PSN243 TaxID=3040156 RepID=A0AAV9H174_9PEZI|nr:hypothetical protein QBC34DRAFT_435051 [Podospora aff. communis PSN243]